MKRLVILGSTGSIGTNTLDIVTKFPGQFQVVGLTAGTNDDKLEEQMRLFKPAVVALSDEQAAARLRARCGNISVEILSGVDGVAQVAQLPEVDLVISAIVGGAGLVPTLAAIRAGKNVALANKEPMVMAGQMMQMMGPGHMMGPGMMGHGMGMAPGAPWTALRDSIQGDLSIMPGLSGKDLAARSHAHIDRMRRMMVLGMGMMGGGGWAMMPGGCGMLDSVGRMSANQAQSMWTMHSQMSGQMISAMMANMRSRGVAPSPQWLALRDSVQADMAELPKLKGDPLRSRMQAHADRMHRLMGLQAQAMGMPMGPMGMSCQW